jgi:hypothetical protein
MIAQLKVDCQPFAYNSLKFSSAKQQPASPIALHMLRSSPVGLDSLRVSFQQLILERTGERRIELPKFLKNSLRRSTLRILTTASRLPRRQ